MHAVNLVGEALTAVDVHVDCRGITEAICAITGEKQPCLPRKKVLGGVLLNLDFLRAPTSEFVSVNTARTLAYKWARMSSWICDGTTFIRLDRTGKEHGSLRDIVLTGKYPPIWSGYVTTLYKKHGALYTPVNSGSTRVWRFENVNVNCSDHSRLMSIWDGLNQWIRRGISRRVMETLEPNHFTLKATGAAGWLEFQKWARPIYQSPLYQFMCYLLPTIDDLKKERTADGT